MENKKITIISFSPTGTTTKILNNIALGINVDCIENIDLTSYVENREEVELQKDDLAIIGVPVYGGRVPLDAIERLKQIKANGTLAVVVVVYGNRGYDDALLELKDLVSSKGFFPVAAGAFIAEHSFSNENSPIAAGRPDVADLEEAKEFGRRIVGKLKDIESFEGLVELKIAGDFPYKERKEPFSAAPVTKEEECIKCKKCITACPVGAITETEVMTTANDKCILCNACVRVCPTQARLITDPGINKISAKLSANLQMRNTPNYFM